MSKPPLKPAADRSDATSRMLDLARSVPLDAALNATCSTLLTLITDVMVNLRQHEREGHPMAADGIAHAQKNVRELLDTLERVITADDPATVAESAAEGIVERDGTFRYAKQ